MIAIAAGVFLGLVAFYTIWPRRHAIVSVSAGALLTRGPGAWRLAVRVGCVALLLLSLCGFAAAVIGWDGNRGNELGRGALAVVSYATALVAYRVMGRTAKVSEGSAKHS